MERVPQSSQDFISKLGEEWSHLMQGQSVLTTTATALGLVVSLYFAVLIMLELIQVFRLYVLAQFCCKTNFVDKYGKWAVISGATDGIGQAMAKELAGRGMSIVVVARNEEKLARTKAMLDQVPNVGQVETVKIDLSDSSLDNFGRICAQIDPENRDIGVLINNAATYTERYVRFNRFSIDEIVSMVNLNVLATLHLTRMIMPAMVQRNKGLVLNVSSGFGAVPLPFLNVYGATKAFLDYFSHQLQIEYSSHPIDIVLLQPGPVCTNRLKATTIFTRASFMVPTPEAFVKSTINALSCGVSTYAGVMFHGLLVDSLRFAHRLHITPIVMKQLATFCAKSFDLSPVTKRKRLVKTKSTIEGDNGALAETKTVSENLGTGRTAP